MVYPASVNLIVAKVELLPASAQTVKIRRLPGNRFMVDISAFDRDRTETSERWIVMRGITPVPFAKTCFPQGAYRNIAFPTHHLRAYRDGTPRILLHLVLQGEHPTRYRCRCANYPKIVAPSGLNHDLSHSLCVTRYPCAPWPVCSGRQSI